MISAIIFDWAGTTVDFGCFAPVQAFINAFEKYGITPTIEEVRKPMGMLKKEHIKTMMHMERIHRKWMLIYGKDFTEEDIDDVYRTSELSILNILADFADPKPYVVETVNKLRNMGIKIGSTTGYTDEMMNVVVPLAKQKGYSPDCWFSAESVDNIGRPYPYMIFKNMETLKIPAVKNAVKVGDTVADIKEGKAAGVISVGVIEGSSVMALSENEYNILDNKQKMQICNKVKKIFLDCGADHVITNMLELPDLITSLNSK